MYLRPITLDNFFKVVFCTKVCKTLDKICKMELHLLHVVVFTDKRTRSLLHLNHSTSCPVEKHFFLPTTNNNVEIKDY